MIAGRGKPQVLSVPDNANVGRMPFQDAPSVVGRAVINNNDFFTTLRDERPQALVGQGGLIKHRNDDQAPSHGNLPGHKSGRCLRPELPDGSWIPGSFAARRSISATKKRAWELGKNRLL